LYYTGIHDTSLQVKNMVTKIGENTPPGYPGEYEAWFTVKDGRRVFIRPIKPADQELLLDLFQRLSDHSIQMRFLGHLPGLSPELLDYLTIVNYVSDFAIVAMVVEKKEDHIIAVCRYHSDSQTNSTELAVAVRDDWQGMGLGKEMVRRLLTIARDNGIRRIEAVVDPSNAAFRKLLNALGSPYTSRPLHGFYRFLMEL